MILYLLDTKVSILVFQQELAERSHKVRSKKPFNDKSKALAHKIGKCFILLLRAKV